jgi:hypothetical protein
MTKHAIAIVLLLSAAARADDGPPPHALVVHVAPTASPVGAPIELEATIDAPFAETLAVKWRAVGEPTWHDTGFERSSTGAWYASLPPAAVPGVEYFIVGTDRAGVQVPHFASAEAPHLVRVEPSLIDRLEMLDRQRLEDRVDGVSFDVTAHNFGNRYGLSDNFIRTELVYTHRFLRILDEVGFGFGTIDGKTPEMAAADSSEITRGLRYGFGQVRLRIHPSVFVDGRVGLGVSDEGFEQNIRGAVTFGKPWRSNVSVGAEYLGNIGPTAWVRLQWDTAAPFLMGASVVRTDLPGAVIARIGLYLAYDIAYRIADRITLRAQLSYGSRDGAAHFGGGAGTAVAF